MVKIAECKKIMKKCSKCGQIKFLNEFEKRKEGLDGRRGTCKKCRNKKRKPKYYSHICKTCGKEFKSTSKNSNYCSNKCKPQNMPKKIKTNCSYCGKEIYVTEYRFKNHKYHCCSPECQHLGFKTKFKGENNPNYKGKSYKYKCDYCGKEFITNNYGDRNSKYHYCSSKCKAEHQKEILKGINNPNYGNRGENNPLWNPNRTDEERMGVRNIYGYKEFVINVLERDNYTCQCCGDKIHGNGIVHHLDGYNWCTEKRTDETNGITLCEDCHNKFHNIYGKGNNTKEQFEKFIKNIKSA